LRRVLVLWLYANALGHVMVGLALPWLADLPILAPYHHSIEAFFWPNGAPGAAHAQQLWWIGLFGPTLQNVGLWMAALVRVGDVHKSRFAWQALIAGLLLWAPQDMLYSLRAAAWIHVWVDTLALLTMLPPLFWLLWHDCPARTANRTR
jgi:hypothetical protein